MDLSVNKINQKSNNLSFKGLEGAYNKNSKPVYRFYAPAHNKNEQVFLEFATLTKNDKTAQFNPPNEMAVFEVPFNAFDTIDLQQDQLKGSEGFGYRFKIVNTETKKTRYAIDSSKSIEIDKKGNKMNVIETGRFYGISPKGETMRHSFLDSDVKLDASGMRVRSNAEFARNHFNKLGGSINGLNWLLENSDELEPYGYFMTTPDIGADKVSSHKYWPSNHYQCSNLDNFKEFNFNLFKRGKGYVADGAFTSQGLQSPLVQHVLKWGKESPFYNWLKIDGPITLGVLPDKDAVYDVNPYEHIGVRLVNPKGDNYDKTKPTYIQFYDDRLLSKGLQKDGKLHFDYDIAPDDIYEITTHQDSVQPFAFEVNPNDEKIKAFEGKNAILLKDIKDSNKFLKFNNFAIGEKNKVAGVTCWDGNVDIIKMNLSNPNIKKAGNKEGFFAAREYLFGVADYWTETIQSHLILETAKAKNKQEIAKNNGVNIAELNTKEGFHSLVALNRKTSSEIIKNFPLQTLETSEELSAIFAQPKFNEQLFTKETLEKVQTLYNSVISKVVGSKGDEYKMYVEKTYGNEILRYIFASAMNEKAIDKRGKINLDELNKVTLKSMGNAKTPQQEVANVVKTLKDGLSKVEVNSLAQKISAETKNITLEDFKLAEAIVLQGKGGLNWRFDAAKDIGDLDAVRAGTRTFSQIWDGDKDIPGVQDFWADYVQRIRKYNPASYIINEVTSLSEFCDWKDEVSREKFDPQLAEVARRYSDEDKNNYDKGVIYQKQVNFLDKTNSTTTSEYSKGFNTFSMFAGVNPEKISNSSGAGDLAKVKSAMETLMAYNQPNSSIYSHMFVSNHDKPSILHTLPLDMSAYLAKNGEEAKKALESHGKEKVVEALLIGIKPEEISKINPKALSVAVPMYETISELYSKEQKDTLVKNLKKLVLGKTLTGRTSFKRAEAFGVKPYELTIQDLLKKSGFKGEELKKETLNFHYNMMKSSMSYYERLWQVMNACVGTPTLYGGHEFAQTGYETSSKNEYLGIRNEVLHGLKNEPGYKEYYEKMQKTSGLYQQPGLSALRNGAPVSLDMISAEEQAIKKLVSESNDVFDYGKLNYFANQILGYLKDKGKNVDSLTLDNIIAEIKKSNGDHSVFGIAGDNGNPEAFSKSLKSGNNIMAKAVKAKIDFVSAPQIWPVYKKDSKGSETISIITNLGLPKGKASFEQAAQDIKAYSTSGIPLTKGAKAFEGFEDAVFKQVGDGEAKYKIENGVLKKIGDSTEIILKDTVSTFYRVAENV